MGASVGRGIAVAVPRDDAPMEFGVYADSDFAAYYARRSMQGIVIALNGGPISWSSILGKTTVLSTCEAEVSAAVTASKDAIHLKRVMINLGLMSADYIFCDCGR